MSDDDKKRESHIGDALAHAMVPPTGPTEPEPAPVKSAVVPDEVAEAASPTKMSDEVGRSVQSGEMVLQFERLWPLLWLAMLTVVSVIGIYNAVRHLP